MIFFFLQLMMEKSGKLLTSCQNSKGFSFNIQQEVTCPLIPKFLRNLSISYWGFPFKRPKTFVSPTYLKSVEKCHDFKLKFVVYGFLFYYFFDWRSFNWTSEFMNFVKVFDIVANSLLSSTKRWYWDEREEKEKRGQCIVLRQVVSAQLI